MKEKIKKIKKIKLREINIHCFSQKKKKKNLERHLPAVS